MSERRYYSDSYKTQFAAQVVERTSLGAQQAIILDETWLYPTSGGQPHDTGTIAGQPVVDVFVRDDGAVVHVVDGQVAVGRVSAEIDWSRRFDHMQQHSGQHILSRAFIELAAADTVGFHLSDEASTIDLNIEQLTDAQVAEVERRANEVVWQNRPIRARFLPRADALALPLRKVPDVAGDTLRIVEIEGFDWNACGGTHVAHTGEVGLIKITRLSRQKRQLRVEFRCGQRAVADYDVKHGVVTALSNRLTCGIEDVEPALVRLQDELKDAQRQLKKTRAALFQLEAAALLHDAPHVGTTRLVVHCFEQRDDADVKQLAGHLTRQTQAVALLGVAGSAATFLFTRSHAAPGDMHALLQPVLSATGGRGGGGAPFAFGGGTPVKANAMRALLNSAEKQWHQQVNGQTAMPSGNT